MRPKLIDAIYLTINNALGIAFSQGVEKGSQDIPVYDNMYDNILYSSLMLQDLEDASRR